MIFNWYKIVNRNEFEATGLVSRELTVVLQGFGSKDFMITVGNLFSLIVDGIMLPVMVSEKNPAVSREDLTKAIFEAPNGDIYYGILVE